MIPSESYLGLSRQNVRIDVTIGFNVAKANEYRIDRVPDDAFHILASEIGRQYGGVSVVRSKGHYVHHDGTMVQEDSVTLTLVTDATDAVSWMERRMARFARTWWQESILMTVQKLDTVRFIGPSDV